MHFAAMCSPVPGHLMPNTAVARALVRRGHRVTFFQIADARAEVERQGLLYEPLGAREFPLGSWVQRWAPIRDGVGVRAQLATLKLHRTLADLFCRDVSLRARPLGIDALLVDQMQPQGAALAEHLGVPFATVCITVPLHPDLTGNYPPIITSEGLARNGWERLRNRWGHRAVGLASLPLLEIANRWRRKWGLPQNWDLPSQWSRQATVCAMPPELEFEGVSFDPPVHYLGPFLEPARPEPSFDFDRLGEGPFVYLSAGSLRNRMPWIHESVIEACRSLGLRLVVSAGAWCGLAAKYHESDSVRVFDWLPQRAVLERASVCVTHAGANTTLEALYAGIPLLAVPITDEQPAVAARVARAGAGIHLRSSETLVRCITEALEKLVYEPKYRETARSLGAVFQARQGADQAARLIEECCGKQN